MSGYSRESHRLALQLAKKAAGNIRRLSGRRTVVDPETGRYTVSPQPGVESKRMSSLMLLIRAQGHPELSADVSERLWTKLDEHPSFLRLPVESQQDGFEFMVDKLMESPVPATAEEVDGWRAELYGNLKLKPLKYI